MVDGRDLPAVQLIQLIFEWMFLTVFNHYLLEKAVKSPILANDNRNDWRLGFDTIMLRTENCQ